MDINTLLQITKNGESWKQVPNYPKYYVSNMGRVYSEKKNDILKGEYSPKGYHYVRLYNDKHIDGKKIKVSHVVVMAFSDRFKKGMEVHHINCNSADDRLINLLPVTKAEHKLIHAFYGYIIKSPQLIIELFKRKKPDINITLSDDMKGGDAA